MLTSPWMIFWLLLAGAAPAAAAAWRQPRFARPLALGAALLAGLIWLINTLRNQPWPLRFAPPGWFGGALPPYYWEINVISWSLSGALLLLLTAVLLADLFPPPAAAPTRTRRQPAAALLLGASVLLTLWAASLPGLLLGWCALAGAWTLVYSGAQSRPAAGAGLPPRLGWLLLPLLLLAGATAWSPPGAALAGNNRHRANTALVAGGSLPRWGSGRCIAGVRCVSLSTLPGLPLLHLAPPLAGVALLTRLAFPAPGLVLLLTLIGLLSMLAGVRHAWAHAQTPQRTVAALALLQASLTFLAGLWAGATAAVAEAHVLALALTVLFLALYQQPLRRRWQPLLGALAALAALAGLPPTVGFVGHGALYAAWLANGRFVLMLASALLLAPVIALTFSLLRERSAAPEAPETSSLPARLATVASLLLPLAGLFVFDWRALTTVSQVVALVLLATAVAGLLLLPRLLSEHAALRRALRQAFSVRLETNTAVTRARQARQGLITALTDAEAILEGERGLLWLLLFLVIFLLYGL
jgi:hypothetical protein